MTLDTSTFRRGAGVACPEVSQGKGRYFLRQRWLRFLTGVSLTMLLGIMRTLKGLYRSSTQFTSTSPKSVPTGALSVKIRYQGQALSHLWAVGFVFCLIRIGSVEGAAP